MRPISLYAPPTVDLEATVGALAAGLELEAQEARTSRVRFFDSFDWRLHRAGYALARQDGAWRLEHLDDRTVVTVAPARAGPWPRFAGDFDATTELGTRLRKLLKMRALVHLLTLSARESRWALRNRDGKIVLRLQTRVLRPEKPPADIVLTWLDILPLRGYEEQAARAHQAAEKAGLTPARTRLLDTLLEAVGLHPRSYSSKFRADIAPDLSAREAFAEIGRTLMRTLRQNETGLRADIDTEFLHDFRVAVRRQRSALGHFRGVVDAEAVTPFAEGFARLGRLTGTLRDLDVDLLERDRKLALLPASLRPGLEARYVRVASRREAELARVRRALAAPAYHQLVQDWLALLDDLPPGPLADLPVHELARRRLRKRHRRVLRDGAAIVPAAPDRQLHRLRIQCKKLRYLLEFMATVFPAGEVEALVKHLKGLQDNLGEFNDLCVQSDDLHDALENPGGRGRARLREAAALGGLLTALAARREVVRAEFAASFAAFAADGVTARFERLQADRPGGRKART